MINLKLSKLDKLDTLEVEVKEVKATLYNANESINGLKAENVALKMQVKSLEESLNTSKKDFAAMKERVIDIQARSMRENLIFYGIEETENHEAGLYSEEVLKNFFEKELEINTSNSELDRVRRMGKPKFRDDGSKLPRPIVAKFQRFKQKEQVKRSAVKLKGKKPLWNF